VARGRKDRAKGTREYVNQLTFASSTAFFDIPSDVIVALRELARQTAAANRYPISGFAKTSD
jgi:hypothetical protein